MKKIVSILVTAALAITVAAPFIAESAAAQKVSLKLGHVAAAGDNVDLTAQRFAKRVAELSGGAISVRVYPASTLGDYRELIEGMRPGLVDIVIESPSTLDAYSPIASIDAYPYLFRDVDHLLKFIASPVSKEFFSAMGAGEVHVMAPMYRGTRYLTSKKPVRSADDVKGLKVRVPTTPIYVKTWERLGAICTPMAFNEIYTALQQGTVDAQENPLVQSFTAGFGEVVKHVVDTRHVVGIMIFMMDEKKFGTLPKEYREWITQAAEEASAWRTQVERDNETTYLKKFTDAGCEYIQPDLETFKAKVADIGDDFPQMKEWVEKIRAIQ